jgi:hypothetical protein
VKRITKFKVLKIERLDSFFTDLEVVAGSLRNMAVKLQVA